MTNSAPDTIDYGAAIAIIGMSGRFPDAPNVDALWKNIAAGERGIRRFSDSELLDAGVDPALLQHPNYVKAGTLIEDIDRFDATFFGYPPREAEIMDPQHRLFLECAWEALEQAAYAPETYPGLIGVFGGSGFSTYLMNNLASHSEFREALGSLALAVGNERDSLASTVSYKLNLRGPSVAVQTFCSTSLVAVHLACQSLLTYDCDLALAGGVAIEIPQGKGYLYEEGGIVSPDGYCRTFDARAQGSVMGNGVGVVALKRMEDALADGDHIYAVIRGSAMNNDGLRKVGYTAPGLGGQMAVIVNALNNADVPLETIGYIEAHGTATPLGDAVELAALIKAFEGTERKQFCALGSIKPNIGHLDRASGVTGLIKTTLSLVNQTLPPSIDFESPSPDIDLDNSPFYVNTKATAWPAGSTPRRAGVSSFGLGGTNAHVVLEEAPLPPPSAPSRPAHLLVLSAKTATALDAATDNLVAHLHQQPAVNLADVAYTLQVGRSVFPHRRSVVVRDVADAIDALTGRDPQRVISGEQTSRDRPVALLLGGVGDQYVGLGRALYESEPSFRATVDACCLQLSPLLGLDLRALLWPDAEPTSATPTAPIDLRALLRRNGTTPPLTGPLAQPTVGQAAVFVVEYALASLLHTWGIQPQALLGYSLGELVAATLAGVLTLPDALRLVVTRARLLERLPESALLTVALSAADVTPHLPAGCTIAIVTGPRTCVVGGPPQAITLLSDTLHAQEIACRPIATTQAVHTALMEPIAAELTAFVRTLALQPPQIPLVSNVTGTWLTNAQAIDPAYWAQHLCQPVQFDTAIATLLERKELVVVEVGAGAALTSFVKQHPACDRAQAQRVLPTLPAAGDATSALSTVLTALGRLWLAGVSVEWSALYSDEQRRRVPLPTYPFERQRYWIERKRGMEPDRPALRHTSKKADVADWFYMPVWRQALPLSPVEPDKLLQSGDWLVFADRDSLSTLVIEQLAAQNCNLVIVRPGRSFTKHSDQEYSICPDHAPDYQRLLSELRNPLTTIVHLWTVAPQLDQLAGIEAFDPAQQTGFYSLLYLVKALGTQLITSNLDLWIVAQGVYSITGQEQLRPEYATLVGARTVIGQENLNITCRLLDTDRPVAGSWREQRLARNIAHELLAQSPDLEVAYRDDRRWQQSYQALRLTEPTVGPLRSRGSYLITGGFGAIGMVLSEHLARTVQARLILTTHSPIPSRDEWATLLACETTPAVVRDRIQHVQSLEALGAEVLVLSADVADQRQMQQVIDQTLARFGQLHGVIHTAGISHADGFQPIQAIQEPGCELHFVPKARGLYVLEHVLGDRELDFCILFSSLASVLGGLGFVGYSAANSFMDAFAHRHNLESPQRWISVSWDTWQIKEDTHGDLAITVLEYAMTRAEAITAFERVAANGTMTHLVNSTGDLDHRLDQWVRGLSLRAEEPSEVTLYPRPTLETPYVVPLGETEVMIAEIWQTVLGLEVGTQDNFFDLGGNSLIGTQVISRLRRAFQSNIPLTLLFEAPTVAEMAVAVELQLIAEIDQLDEAEAERLAQSMPEVAAGD
jgi:acyl transferase domain-containing protein/acyl carrier protein